MIRALLQRQETRARIAADRARLGFVNGINWLIRDPQSVVGRSPWDEVHRDGKLVVRRYVSRVHERRHAVPLLLIPPLMVKPFVFDLHPGRSMVAHLLRSGFAVYLVDFGEPDSADEYVGLDRYVMDWLPTACETVRKDAGVDAVSLVGYCMGALFGLCHVAANEDATVRNIVAIAAPVDTHKMGMFAWLAKNGGRQVEAMIKQVGNVPGGLSSAAFRMLSPMKNLTRYADLFLNMWDREYVNGFDAMNQWTGQFIDYPQEAFIEFMREFMRKNKLVQGKLQFRDKVVDLGTVKSSLLLFAGEGDQVAPEPAVRGALDVVGTEDKQLLVVPGGHMGVMAGSAAPARVWTPTADWLAERSAGA